MSKAISNRFDCNLFSLSKMSKQFFIINRELFAILSNLLTFFPLVYVDRQVVGVMVEIFQLYYNSCCTPFCNRLFLQHTILVVTVVSFFVIRDRQDASKLNFPRLGQSSILYSHTQPVFCSRRILHKYSKLSY